MTTEWLQCERCGQDCVESDAAGLFLDGQEATCPDCGSVNVVHTDEDGDVWLRWTCKHGKDDETPCPECDAEDEAASGRQRKGGRP